MFAISIEGLTAEAYSSEERRVWKSGAQNIDKWKMRLNTQYFILAELGDELVGMGSIEDHYIDVLYVHPSYSGKGIAFQLYQRLEKRGIDLQLEKLETDASYLARPFFERQGFKVIRKNSNAKGGEVLINFRMTKNLKGL